MKRVLVDVCVPRRVQNALHIDFPVETAQDAGLDDLDDGPLLDAIEGRFDVLVTRDRNLAYQQKMRGRSVAVVVLVTKDQSSASFLALLPALKTAITQSLPGTVTEVGR
jgi:predicted nuclease of predicted toxin-antitoxin system